MGAVSIFEEGYLPDFDVENSYTISTSRRGESEGQSDLSNTNGGGRVSDIDSSDINNEESDCTGGATDGQESDTNMLNQSLLVRASGGSPEELEEGQIQVTAGVKATEGSSEISSSVAVAAPKHVVIEIKDCTESDNINLPIDCDKLAIPTKPSAASLKSDQTGASTTKESETGSFLSNCTSTSSRVPRPINPLLAKSAAILKKSAKLGTSRATDGTRKFEIAPTIRAILGREVPAELREEVKRDVVEAWRNRVINTKAKGLSRSGPGAGSSKLLKAGNAIRAAGRLSKGRAVGEGGG